MNFQYWESFDRHWSFFVCDMQSWNRLNHNGNLVFGLINCPGPSHTIITIVRTPQPIMGSDRRYETLAVRAAAGEGPCNETQVTASFNLQ